MVTKIDNLDLSYAENILKFLSNPIAYDLLFMQSSTDDADIDEESMLDAVGYGLSSIEELDNLTGEETEEEGDDLYDEVADDETGLDGGDGETDTVEDDGTGNVIDGATGTTGDSGSGAGGTGGAGTGGTGGAGGTGDTGGAGGDSGGADTTGGDVDDSDYGVPYFTAGNC
ncbi:MAG: hypothetical protein QXF12_03505 [Candidatus Aenigmatarchaeota archaeon]